jgi:hypothetical protein
MHRTQLKKRKNFFFDSLGSISSPKTLAVSSPVLPQHKPKDIDNIRNIMRLSLSEEQRKQISSWRLSLQHNVDQRPRLRTSE